MTISKSIGILNTSSPFQNSNAKDSLDVALIMGTFEQQTSLFFQGEGVWLLIKQQPESINVKDFLKTFSAFEFYDIEEIFVCEKSLHERGITPSSFHIENITILDQRSFADTLGANDIIFRF